MFYHLSQRSIDETLVGLLGRCLEQGWQVAIQSASEDRIAQLDDSLWQVPLDQFLPHGRAGKPNAGLQPILLTNIAEHENGANCVMLLDGAPVHLEHAPRLERLCILFEDHNQDVVVNARKQWKEIASLGIEAEYWSDATGGWKCMHKTAPKAPELNGV